jgi:hypothetical protein
MAGVTNIRCMVSRDYFLIHPFYYILSPKSSITKIKIEF